jgi:hypothetical protein
MENYQQKLQLVLRNWRGHGVDVTLSGAMSLMRSTCSGSDAHVSPATHVYWPRDGPPGGGLTIHDMEWVPCLRSKASRMYSISTSSVLYYLWSEQQIYMKTASPFP